MDSELLNKLKQYFKTKPVLKAYVFGSFARGEQTPDSDLDILLELDYSNPIGLRFIQMQNELQELIQQKVDLVTMKSISKYLFPIIDKEKVLVYEK